MPGWGSLASVKQIDVVFQIGVWIFFALVAYFEALAYRRKNDPDKEGYFRKRAIIFFAIAVFCEGIEFAYSRRAETLFEAELDERQATVVKLSEQLKEATTPKPLVERVRTFLNGVSAGFIQKLTNGDVHGRAYLTGPQRDEFERLLATPGCERYLTRLPEELDMQRFYTDGSTKYGATFLISTNVLENSRQSPSGR